MKNAKKETENPENMSQFNDADLELYKKIEKLLSPTGISSDLLEGSKLNLPNLEFIAASGFHHLIVNHILRKNKKIMNLSSLWALFSRGLNHSQYHNYRVQFQALNLGIKAIYHWKAPRKPDPRILAAIDHLLLNHIKAMHDSGLFKGNLYDIYKMVKQSGTIKLDADATYIEESTPAEKTSMPQLFNAQSENRLVVYTHKSFFGVVGKWLLSWLPWNSPQVQVNVPHEDNNSVEMNSVTRIIESLQTPDDSFLVNAFIANRLGTLGNNEH